ncbi:MAG: hypothetical protein F4W90_06930 [Gammaproteobacteria bacterium]|nr:hypothetical protein [Gammaproteobacteria bacterium]
MEIFAQLTGSQLLVTASLVLFALLILSSVYLRLQAQYRTRHRLAGGTRKDVLNYPPNSNSKDFSKKTMHSEVVTRARPKGHTNRRGTPVNFGIHDEFKRPEHADDSDYEVVVDSTKGNSEAFDYAQSTGSDQANVHYAEGWSTEDVATEDYDSDYSIEASTTEQSESESESAAFEPTHWETPPSITNNVASDSVFEDTDDWTAHETESECQSTSEVSTHVDDSAFHDDEPNESYDQTEYVEEVAASDTYDEAFTATPEPVTTTEEDTAVSDELLVAPFDHRVAEVQRVASQVGRSATGLSVVSICLISEYQGRFFRDIQGEQLGTFLTNRNFILLDEEYHLQSPVVLDAGGIRIRNFEMEPIGELVKTNGETRGFRIYFRPGDCADPLSTFAEMMRIAESARQFFAEACEKPLEIWDGRKPIQPLSQEGYKQLVFDLQTTFTMFKGTSYSRTTLSRNEFEPSDSLVSQASQY